MRMHAIQRRNLLAQALTLFLLLKHDFLSCAQAQEGWVDVSSSLLARLTNNGAKLAWPGGVSGVVVNRTNADVIMKIVGSGLWRSSDKGQTWTRIDENVVSGRDETGWATSLDQNAPGRLASFSLDGSAGWTIDGVRWQAFTTLGRNWDYGSIDWDTPKPQTIIAAKHETTPPGEIYVSEDGGLNWTRLAVHLSENRGRVSMVGALGPKTLIYSNGDGIQRSTDSGLSWAKVSPANPQTRIPVLFQRAHYLGTTNGLIVSRDLGLTWRLQGAPVNIWQGPFFGRTEQEIAVVGVEGIFISRDAGESWKRVAGLKSKETGFLFSPNWFGCYAWDPLNNAFYASAMGNPLYRLDL
jgi:photosystem II stability/assembly factor-like uncharacterized protein